MKILYEYMICLLQLVGLFATKIYGSKSMSSSAFVRMQLITLFLAKNKLRDLRTYIIIGSSRVVNCHKFGWCATIFITLFGILA